MKLDDVTLIESDTRCSMIFLIQNLKNITYQTKPTKPNLPNQTEETKTYQIEFTKPNLVKLNIEFLIDLKHESKSTQSLGPLCLWQCFQHQLFISFYLGFFHPRFSNINYFSFSILSLLDLSFCHVERKEFKEMYFVRTSLQPNHQIINWKIVK